MRYTARVLIPVVLSALAFSACSGTTDPDADEVVIVVATTGGIVAMDWQVTLHGRVGTVFLDRCAQCPWESNSTSRDLTDDEIEAIADRFVQAGVREQASIDYGICEGCADQWHHVIEYRDHTGTYRIQGDGPNLPAPLEQALAMFITGEPLPAAMH
jgi:hypothetical protein